jgi:hypothetical protein
VWQALRNELHPQGLELVTVALDVEVDDARPFVEAAGGESPALIDRGHVVDELFGIVNVPQGVWIDEDGMIVRPPEAAHIEPSPARQMRDGELDTSNLPPDLAEAVALLDYDHELYLAALRDWVERGSSSEWALDPDEVIARSAPRSDAPARAAAHFELGQYLHERGAIEAAREHWREAHRLQPDNWTYKRQAWHLVAPGTQGPNGVYESYWLRDFRERGAESYYPPLQK